MVMASATGLSEEGYPYVCTGNCPHEDKVPMKPVTFKDKSGCIQTYDHSHNVVSVPQPDCTNAKIESKAQKSPPKKEVKAAAAIAASF